MAIYWQDREWWRGSLTAFGGSSSQGGNGGAGTVYLVVRKILYSEGTMCCYPKYVLKLTLVFFCLTSGYPTRCEQQDSDLR